MKELVVLVEEKSMKELLNILLPKILSDEISFRVISFEGKSDLEISGLRKLSAWQNPDAKFIISRDQDAGNCTLLKQELVNLCRESARNEFLVRIVCHELEAWYFGDLKAVEAAYGGSLEKYSRKAKYRIPDDIINPSVELKKLVPNYTKVLGAQSIAQFMDINKNTSKSFQVFVAGVRRLCQ